MFPNAKNNATTTAMMDLEKGKDEFSNVFTEPESVVCTEESEASSSHTFTSDKVFLDEERPDEKGSNCGPKTACHVQGCRYKRKGYVYKSRYARNAAFSILAVNAAFAIFSLNSIGSIASINSCFSIGSVNSLLSIGCANSFMKVCL